MKKLKVRRLTLHRETIQHLDDPAQLRELAGGLSSQCSYICCPVAGTNTCTEA